MHMQTYRHHNPGWEVKLWGLYNQFSMWAVIFMTVSGFYMWLATAPGDEMGGLDDRPQLGSDCRAVHCLEVTACTD